MDSDRLMIAEAVFKGLIGEEHLTTEEIDEFMLLVAETAMEKEMDRAAERGCSVFEEEDSYLH